MTREIDDQEDLIHQRRIKTIFDARDNLHQTRSKIEFEQQGDARVEVLTAYRSLVSSYLLEVEPLMQRYETGQQLLDETEFGTVKLEPEIYNGKIQYRPGKSAKIDRSDVPEPKQYKLTGLSSLFTVPNPVEYDRQIPVNDRSVRGNKTTMVDYSRKAQIRMSTLDTMTRSINQFLAEIGFTVDQEPEDNPAQI